MEAEKSATSLDGLFELLDESRFRTMDLFAMLDTDRSGTVEMQELHNTLCGPLGIEVTESDTRRLFEMLDVDSSGSVSIAEFLKRMRQAQLQRRAAAKAEARRKVIEARKLGQKEAELAAATKERLQAFEKLGRVDTRPRPAKADEALLRIMAYLEKNKLKMVDVFNKMDKDDSGYIDAEEMELTLRELGLELTPEEAAQVCGDMDVDGDGTVERAEFFKRYKLLSRERRQATWRQQRRAKDSHSFRTMAANTENLQLDRRARRPWVWRPTQYRVQRLAEEEEQEPGAAAPAAQAAVKPLLSSDSAEQFAARKRPSSAPAMSRASRPGSGTRRALPGKTASAITKHLQRLKPTVDPTDEASAAAEKEWKKNYVDHLLAILDEHKLKLQDLFREIDSDKVRAPALLSALSTLTRQRLNDAVHSPGRLTTRSCARC